MVYALISQRATSTQVFPTNTYPPLIQKTVDIIFQLFTLAILDEEYELQL